MAIQPKRLYGHMAVNTEVTKEILNLVPNPLTFFRSFGLWGGSAGPFATIIEKTGKAVSSVHILIQNSQLGSNVHFPNNEMFSLL